MSELTITVFGAVIGSNALFAFIQFMITRNDTKKSVKGKLTLLEKDVLRTQLLLLILLKPEEKQEILTIGEHYFSKPPQGLGGDWYMTSIFGKWLKENSIEHPRWFSEE